MSDVVSKLFEPIGEVVKLPSKGTFGGPKQVTVRGLLTKDEKDWIKIDPENPGPGLRILAKNVVTAPEKFTLKDLIDADVVAILTTARALTYGDKISVTTKCPYCETIQKFDINITDFPMRFHKKLKLPLSVKLPKSGLTIDYKLLSLGDQNRIEQSDKEFQKIVGTSTDDIASKVIASMIEEVKDKNGKPADLDIFEKTDLVEKLPKADSEAWAKHRSEYDCGPEFKAQLECSKCGESTEQIIVIGYRFFFSQTERLLSYWSN